MRRLEVYKEPFKAPRHEMLTITAKIIPPTGPAMARPKSSPAGWVRRSVEGAKKVVEVRAPIVELAVAWNGFVT